MNTVLIANPRNSQATFRLRHVALLCFDRLLDLLQAAGRGLELRAEGLKQEIVLNLELIAVDLGLLDSKAS